MNTTSIRSIRLSAAALLVVGLSTLSACGEDIPCVPAEGCADVRSRDGSTSLAQHEGAAMHCDHPAGCDPYPPPPSDADSGTAGVTRVTITVVNDDDAPRTFNGDYIVRDSAGVIVRRQWFLPAVDMQAHETTRVVVDMPTTNTIGIGVSGYWLAGGGAYGTRYETDYRPVVLKTYDCVVRYESTGGQGRITATGCP